MMKIVLETKYIASEKNKFCKDTDDIPVLDLTTCKAEDAGYKFKVNGRDTIIYDHDTFEWNRPNFPYGCFLIPQDDNSAPQRRFNHHIDGTRNIVAQQVCFDRGR